MKFITKTQTKNKQNQMTEQIPKMQLEGYTPEETQLAIEADRRNQKESSNGKPPADAKALRTEHVGKLLGEAYEGASKLKLKPDEIKKLTADFPDIEVEIRPHDGIIYISHMTLRERLWSVFGPGEVAEICRERFMRPDTNEIAVDLVLMVRGHFVAEGIGTAKYFSNNPKMTFGDVVESAWSDAIRRCCKKFGVGVQVWRPGYVREWLAKNAVEYQGRWQRKDATAPPERKKREYTLKEPTPARATALPEDDDDNIPGV